MSAKQELLRGHAYFVELVGRRGPGPFAWIVALAVGLVVAVHVAIEVLR